LKKISGSNSKKNKLTEEQVVKIFHDARKYKKIAKDYSVSEVMISKIKNKKVWRHVTTWL
jgi:DNA invertase Pin-like site-specific DNA recombinase